MATTTRPLAAVEDDTDPVADGRVSDRAPDPRAARARHQARAYLDLWERHIALTAVDGPIRPGRHLPA